MIGRVAFALLLGGLVAPGVKAQAPPSTMPPASATPARVQPVATPPADTPPPPPTPAALPAQPANANNAAVNKPAAEAKKVNVQPLAAVNNRDPLTAKGRFANPGGVGKVSEYYTPNTPMHGYPGLVNRHATFGNGGGVSRADQLQAFQAGQFRTQNIQNNINVYGRPVGFGFGYGLGFGRGLGGYPR